MRGSPPRLPRHRGSHARRSATHPARRGPRERAAPGGDPALETRRGAREEARAAFPTHALEGKIAGVPARRIGGLVRGSSSSTTTARPSGASGSHAAVRVPIASRACPWRHAHHAAQRSRGEAALVTSRAGSPRRVSSRAAQARASSISGARTRTLPPVASVSPIRRSTRPPRSRPVTSSAGPGGQAGGNGASAAGAPDRMPGGSARNAASPHALAVSPAAQRESSSSAGVNAGTGSRMAASASRDSSPGPPPGSTATTTPGRGRPRKGTRTRCPGATRSSSSGGTRYVKVRGTGRSVTTCASRRPGLRRRRAPGPGPGRTRAG